MALKLADTVTAEQFYPTPPALIDRMLDKIDFELCETFLEPEAGKGDIAEHILRRLNRERRHWDMNSASIDCVEIDPYLRQILQYNFSDDRLEEQRKRWVKLNDMLYSDRTTAQNAEMARLKAELDALDNMDIVHIIYDDFLRFHTAKRYHAIVMNPPFAEGDLHLLHAIELQRDGGEIVCILNAETLRNPCTNRRRHLALRLEQYGAEVEYIEGEFLEAEQQTDVEIALVRLAIPRPQRESKIFGRLKEAREQEQAPAEDPDDIVHADYIQAAIEQYDFEVDGTLELIREYEAMKPYMLDRIDGDRASAILTLSLSRDGRNYDQVVDVNKYMRVVRMKYWRALFDNPKFTGMMTSNIRKEYASMVERLRDYDFNRFNIQTLQTEMLSRVTQGVQDTIMALFDKLTVEHSWYPETKQNIHYFNGWKTNQAHKVGKKAIIPTHGMFSSYSWSKTAFNTSTAYEVLSDIEKAFNYLDGGMTVEIDLRRCLDRAAAEGQTRNIECKYFKVDLFKKGTTHIKFTDMRLVDRLNIYAAQHKAWLPPNYGRAAYDDMQPEEQAVVDSFQGREAYEEVRRNAEYYLADVTGIALLKGA